MGRGDTSTDQLLLFVYLSKSVKSESDLANVGWKNSNIETGYSISNKQILLSLSEKHLNTRVHCRAKYYMESRIGVAGGRFLRGMSPSVKTTHLARDFLNIEAYMLKSGKAI